MKIITTLIALIAFQFAASAQVNATASQKRANKTHFFVTTKNHDYLKAKFTPSNECRSVVITDLPVSGDALTTVSIEIKETGAFTFKKDASLNIPFNKEVFIEDKLSGKMFNLKVEQTHTFTIDELIPNRFVMHILEKLDSESMASSN